MKKLAKFLVLPLLAFSCARIPEPVGYTYSTQQKMQAVYHWDVLAKDLANRINIELIRGDFLTTAVYVKPTCGDDTTPCKANETSAFNEGFRDLLITELVGFGIPTTTEPDPEAITINYKVQTIRHRADRLRTISPGLITTLSTAVTVLRNAPSAVVGIATGAGVDFFNATYVSGSHAEILITTSMVFQKNYFFRSADIYYINNADVNQYAPGRDGTAADIELTTGNAGTTGVPAK